MRHAHALRHCFQWSQDMRESFDTSCSHVCQWTSQVLCELQTEFSHKWEIFADYRCTWWINDSWDFWNEWQSQKQTDVQADKCHDT